MKRQLIILTSLIAILISHVAHSQNTTWANPDCYNDIYKTGLTIDNVKFYSDATVIDFTYHNGFAKTGWIQINPKNQIKVYPSGQTFNMVSAEGIPQSPEKLYLKGEEKRSFTCVYPAIPNGTTSFDWLASGTWVINGIRSKQGGTVDNSKGIRMSSHSFMRMSSTTDTSASTTADTTPAPARQASPMSKKAERGPMNVTVGKSVETAYQTWTLKEVELTPSETVCHWSVAPKEPNTYINLTKGTYLMDNLGQRYFITSCNGISMEPEKDIIRSIRTVDFTVTFPVIDNEATSLTFYSSPEIQVKDIVIGEAAPVEEPSIFDLKNSMKFTATGTNFCYLLDNGNWSDYSELKDCNFTIEYNAASKQIIFHTAYKQKYNVADFNIIDATVVDFYCTDMSNDDKCEIEIMQLPGNLGTHLYLSYEDEKICYIITPEEGVQTPVAEQAQPIISSAKRALPSAISFPSYSKAYTNNGMTITKVITDATQTILEFEYIYTKETNQGIWMSPNSSIKAYPSGKKYKVSKIEGIGTTAESANSHHYKGETVKFKAHFPAVPEDTKYFDFIEENEASDWVFCGISDTHQYKRDFIALNCSDAREVSYSWNWYGGTKKFIVATTAMNYDIVALPEWCEIVAKDAEGFQMRCKKDYESESANDYFIVKANGEQIKVNVNYKQFSELDSPFVQAAEHEMHHYEDAGKITLNIKMNIRNATGKNCIICAHMLNPKGDTVNDISRSYVNVIPTTDSFDATATLTIDYKSLNINDMTGYVTTCSLYDLDDQAFIGMGDDKYMIDSGSEYEIIYKPEENLNWRTYAIGEATVEYVRGNEYDSKANYRKAFESFKKSFECGNYLSLVKLAYMYLEGKYVEPSSGTAMIYINKALEEFKEKNLIYPIDGGYWYGNVLNVKGEFCTKVGDWNEAIKIYRTLHKMKCAEEMKDTFLFKAVEEHFNL